MITDDSTRLRDIAPTSLHRQSRMSVPLRIATDRDGYAFGGRPAGGKRKPFRVVLPAGEQGD
jgi:hypothetical protein